jgi:hypothetical protein
MAKKVSFMMVRCVLWGVVLVGIASRLSGDEEDEEDAEDGGF